MAYTNTEQEYGSSQELVLASRFKYQFWRVLSKILTNLCAQLSSAFFLVLANETMVLISLPNMKFVAG